MMPVAGDTSLATIQSAFLRARLACAFAIRSSVSAAKPMTRRGRRGPGCAMVARMSGFATSSSAGGAAPGTFLILPAAALATCQSATAAANTATSAGSAAWHASSICCALSTRFTATPMGSGTRDRSADQRHARAQFGERRRDRMALPSAGAVGDVAHRIDRLVRRSAGDQRVASGERPRRREQRLDRGEDRRRFGEPARAEFVAGHRALVRTHDVNAARGQQGHVRHGRRMLPHPHVHRGRHQHRLVGGQQQRRGKIAREARGHLRQDVRRGRRHHDEVGAARELDVPHLALVGQREQVGVDLAFAQRLQRQRRDELRARLGQHTGDAAASGAQQTDQFERLEGGDATRDDQQDALHADHR